MKGSLSVRDICPVSHVGGVPTGDEPIGRRLALVPLVLDLPSLERLLTPRSPAREAATGPSWRPLLRALAVSVLFDLHGDDLEFQIADRRSLRQFVAGREAGPLPTAAMMETFLAGLRHDGLADGVFARLDQARRRLDAMAGGGAEAMRVISHAAPETPVLPDFLEPDWVDLESRFVAFWEAKRGHRAAPSDVDLGAARPPGLRPFLGALRLADPPDHFIFEHVGEQIRLRNGRGLAGHSIGHKAEENIRRFGSAGLQGYLLQNCRRAIETMRPVAMTSFFRNYTLQACRIWQVTAPVVPSGGRYPDRLVFCALIKPILLT